MKWVKINPEHPNKEIVDLVVELLRQNQVIIHPTETVYGITGLISREEVIRKIQNIKGRASQKPFSIMVSSVEDILSISGQHSGNLRRFLEALFPDAITVLLPRARQLEPEYWNRFPLLGFRLPKHRLSNLLVETVGEPLITTSANFSGEPAPYRAEDLAPGLTARVALVLDGGETPQRVASTVVKIDPEKPDLALVREGAVDWETIQEKFREFFLN